MATKYVTGNDKHGWLDVRIDGIAEITSLPHALKVDHTGTANGREQFKVLEGIRRDMTGSVRLPTTGSQFGAATHGSAARIRFEVGAGRLVFGTQTATAITDATNPVPAGTWTLQIPDEKHTAYGGQYLNRTDHATTWFRIGDGRDRYLHPGRVSAGCVTVTEFAKWSAIWTFLIKARRGDGMNVGSIEVVR